MRKLILTLLLLLITTESYAANQVSTDKLRIKEGGATPTLWSTFSGGDQAGEITYTLPVNDGDADQVLATNGSGVLSWATAGGGGSGDVTAVGDCATGACFTGSSGTTITGTAAGGLTVTAATPGAATAGSSITIQAPNGGSGDGESGGSVYLIAGNDTGGFSGGDVGLQSGGSSTGFAGDVDITGTSATAGDSDGGSVDIHLGLKSGAGADGILSVDGTESVGWTVQAGANTACTSTCSSACVFGFDTGLGGDDLVGCADATADRCLCAGAN